MGYHSYFALQVADYGMTVDEMMKLLDDAIATTKPLYDGLHCWAKHELAARYKRPPPRLIPAHWLGNRWAQTWPGLIESANLDPLFKGSSPETIVKSAENFYVSLGFPTLPPSFWETLGPLPGAAGPGAQEEHPRLGLAHRPRPGRALADERRAQRRNGSAPRTTSSATSTTSCPTAGPRCPILLREGANRAFHEAIGELAKLASQQTPYLVKVGVMPRGQAARRRPAGCCSRRSTRSCSSPGPPAR